jgi:tyrosyl-tRNA synthetase
MAELAADLRFRGLINQMTDPALEARLDGDTLTAYIGFDPTADSLHVGSLLQLCNLRRLQLAGHRPIALAGGGTGFIGDPGGKSEERSLLTEEQLEANLAGIRSQMQQFLDFEAPGANQALLVNNGDWLRSLPMVDFLRDVGKHFSIKQMVAKDSVKSRFERPDQSISYTEFSYMLLQAYDYLHLFDHFDCQLQMGASDQWGNITVGIDLIRRKRQAQVYGLTTPLVLKADGTKFGKTESGTIWLDARRTSPYQLYQFLFRSEDEMVGTYLRYFSFLSHEELLELDAATADAPQERRAQRELARGVCTLVHGAAETERAEQAGRALFGEEVAGLDEALLLDVFAEAPSVTVPRLRLGDGSLALLDLLAESGLVPSKGRARTTIEQGGAYLNNVRVTDVDRKVSEADLVAGAYLVLRRGKKDHALVRFA